MEESSFYTKQALKVRCLIRSVKGLTDYFIRTYSCLSTLLTILASFSDSRFCKLYRCQYLLYGNGTYILFFLDSAIGQPFVVSADRLST